MNQQLAIYYWRCPGLCYQPSYTERFFVLDFIGNKIRFYVRVKKHRRILNVKYLRSSFLHWQGSMSFQGQVSHSVAVAERFLTFYSYILARTNTNTNTHRTVQLQPQHTS